MKFYPLQSNGASITFNLLMYSLHISWQLSQSPKKQTLMSMNYTKNVINNYLNPKKHHPEVTLNNNVLKTVIKKKKFKEVRCAIGMFFLHSGKIELQYNIIRHRLFVVNYQQLLP